ncbi:MAG: serine hydrolase domain-containing protein [Pirellulaceae bacterium]
MTSPADLPVSGTPRPELEKFDAWMKGFLAEHNIPGASLAIAREGKTVYARGFGYADREAQAPVQPDSLFRIASVSKPITAVAILKLVEQEKLKLEDKVLDYIALEPHLEEGGQFDERWRQVTLVECLCHRGGWDRDKSYDPMFQAARMAKSLKIDLPVLTEHVIRFQLGQPLDFEPLACYAYSNFGYCLLGRAIEKASGQPYEQYVREAVFKPLGIERARIGGSLESERADGEVKYYDIHSGTSLAVTGPGAGQEQVPISYGVWRQETLDAHGGWIASAIDLVKFASAFDLVEGGRQTRGGLLKAASVRLMFSPQATIAKPEEGQSGAYYGLGWTLKADEDERLVARHGGALACTAASLMHFPDGTNLALLTNLGQSADGKFLGRSIEGPLTKLVGEVKTWPADAVSP